MNTRLRYLLIFLFDLAAVLVAWVGSFLLRFNFDWPHEYQYEILICLTPLLAIHAAACKWVGLYRGMWMFASISDLEKVIKTTAISGLGLLAFATIALPTHRVPRSVLLLYPLLLLLIMGGGRALWRMMRERQVYGRVSHAGKPVIIVGAGTGGAMLVKALQHSCDWRVVGLLDDDRAKIGSELFDAPILGPVSDMPEALRDHAAKHVILAMPSAEPDILQRAANLAARSGAMVLTVPGLDQLMGGRVAINAMRPVKIEDLLGRQPVSIDTEHVRAMLEGKTILITGAGGSIGSEICRQLAAFTPKRLILLEANEFALYMIEQWLSKHESDLDIVSLMGDVKDPIRVEEVFSTWAPEIVFHAAAYKHVPLVEVGNAWQAVRNNVLGTLQVAQSAQRHRAERFVLISTDKAVNPTNVMGATKRLAEMLCESLHMAGGATAFQIVRFGNVLGSTGSVIPKFQEQIASGGPVTVTHPDINRYFMSIPEAAQLVLQAASMGTSGEIFVLDMGEPVKIVDLARNMIRLAGFTEDEIHIQFTGLRPGEKLYEELLADAEETMPTPHKKLRIARSRPVGLAFFSELLAWLNHPLSIHDDEVKTVLHRWVPEYTPMVHQPILPKTPKAVGSSSHMGEHSLLPSPSKSLPYDVEPHKTNS